MAAAHTRSPLTLVLLRVQYDWRVGKKEVLGLLLRRVLDAGRAAGLEGWQRIVDNLAAQVAALDREYVPELEALLGPAPAWFQRPP
ncbi:MAG: hypothetical protein IT518_25550 [Burkholderiales bacterium]|nr:hypothetical protein [Burkholderiales bacterium]